MELVDAVAGGLGSRRLSHEEGHFTSVPAAKGKDAGLPRHAGEQGSNLGLQASLRIAVGSDNHERSGAKVPDDEVQELERRRIRGMQIVEHHEAWRLCCGSQECIDSF